MTGVLRMRLVSPLLAVSTLMVLFLVVAACGPAATTPAPTSPTTQTTPTVPTTPAEPIAPPTPSVEISQQQAVKPAAEAPKYGGVLVLRQATDTIYFDEGTNRTMNAGDYTHEELSIWDWTKGPAGTGEMLMTYNAFHRQDLYIGSMAERWEYTPPTGMVLYIRKGVHFGLNPALEASRLVNGREMTADDVVFTLKRLFTEPAGYLRNSYAALAAVIQITARDKYTVEIKSTPETFMELYHTVLTFAHIVAPEVVQKYGNVNDWKTQVGTGPFMINDYIPGSLISYVRNPNYWMRDPIGSGKGNQLPYLDGIRILTIPDQSTRQAALRTGKLDQDSGYNLEERNFMLKTAPAVKDKAYWVQNAPSLGMKIYDTKLPFKDVKVRRAMITAIDYKTIVQDYFGGAAEYFNWPFTHLKDYENIWIPPEQMPASVQELYTYNPDKAKQLLKEAGYPNGFKTSLMLLSSQVDYWSIVKDYWAKVGIDLALDIKDTAVHTAQWRNFTYPEMITASTGGIGSYYRLIGFAGPDYYNASQVKEPYIEEVKGKMIDIFSTTLNWNEIDRLYRDLIPKVIDQAYMIPSPTPHYYNLWWPWLKNYSGETQMSFASGATPFRFVWLDRDLKKQMGY